MTYTANIPLSGESLGSTRVRINSNFQQIAAVEAINHVAFNELGEGKHKFLQMPEQGSAPTTAANEAGFYAKVGTNPAEANLFFRGESDGFEYQLTHTIQASASTLFGTNTAYAANHTGGWSFLPGGLIVQYGKRSAAGVTGTTNFPITNFTSVYSLICTGERAIGDRSITITSITPASGFNYKISSGEATTNFYWYAIGI